VFDVDVVLFESPLYTAVIKLVPSGNGNVAIDAVHDALPLVKVTAEQKTPAPFLKFTVPVGD